MRAFSVLYPCLPKGAAGATLNPTTLEGAL